jgi:hypothetical protein
MLVSRTPKEVSMMLSHPQTDDLARVRAEFERRRSESSGRGRIPDRLWHAAVNLRVAAVGRFDGL